MITKPKKVRYRPRRDSVQAETAGMKLKPENFTYLQALDALNLDDIDEYIKTYGDSPDPISPEEFLLPWYEAKSEFLFNIFNNRLIIEEENVKFSEPDDSILININQYIIETPEWQIVIDKFRTMLQAVLLDGEDYSGPHDYVFYQKYDREIVFCSAAMRSLGSARVFLNNRIYSDATIKPSEANKIKKQITLVEGEKPFRAFTNIIKALRRTCQELKPDVFTDEFFDSLIESLEHYRQIQSQCLNRKTLYGTLCLSIHPLDYITMSDNKSGWTSCMTWTRRTRGEYRAGTVEMMNSPLVIVAYLKSDTPYKPCNSWEWNNKKWRSLFIVHRNLITCVRNYPYFSQDLTEAVLHRLADLCYKAGWPAYEERVHASDIVVDADGREISFSTGVMYNDTECNELYYVNSTKTDADCYSWHIEKEAHIEYGGAVFCLQCGTRLEYDVENDDCASLLCDLCSRRSRCYGCGDIIYNPVWINDQPYCEDCVDWCVICGDPVPPCCGTRDHLTLIFNHPQASNDMDKYIVDYVCVCKNCKDKYYRDHIITVDRRKYASIYGIRSILDEVALPSIPEEIVDEIVDPLYPDYETRENLVDIRDIKIS